MFRVDSQLVSVVVPAHNAARFIPQTIRSIQGQRYGDIEILVVDDGSTDDTRSIVQMLAAADTRIRLLQQENLGVAAARNRGLREALGEFVATCDADDLWAEDKLERQVLALRENPRAAAVYCWFVAIDEDDCVLYLCNPEVWRGDIFEQLCRKNFIGNGSSVLMRTAAALEIGGFDTDLKSKGAQGCEDLKLYLELAISHEFEVVEEYCVGYRQTRTNMSSDQLQMLRSYEIIASQLSEKRPGAAEWLHEGRNWMAFWLRNRAAESFRIDRYVTIAWRMMTHDPVFFAKSLYWSHIEPSWRRGIHIAAFHGSPQVSASEPCRTAETYHIAVGGRFQTSRPKQPLPAQVSLDPVQVEAGNV